ncbi:MAG: porin family protein [Gammaproteobacteria bacterium]|nr:porin family protein [Gammaproteobacteria bacterium]
MKTLILVVGLLAHGAALAQSGNAPRANMNYNYGELRYVDTDVSGGDGFRLNGSWELNGDWILVGGITALDFNNNVDSTTLEFGGGYVWNYTDNFDLVTTLRVVRIDVDSTFGGGDDTGLAVAAGARGYLAPQFELRGSINYVNLDDSDTYLEIAGDYHFNRQFSAGISLEFAGDLDLFTLGARWFFK